MSQPSTPEGQPKSAADKAALWRAIAESKRRSASPPEPEPDSGNVQPQAEPTATGSGSGSGWNDLYQSSWEELQHLQVPQAHRAQGKSTVEAGAQTPEVHEPAAQSSASSQHPPKQRTRISFAAAPTPQPAPLEVPSPVPPSSMRAEAAKQCDVAAPSPQMVRSKDSVAAPLSAPALPAVTTEATVNGAQETPKWWSQLADGIERRLPARLRPYWKTWGGESLFLSLGVHALIIAIGAVLVVRSDMMQDEVDFLPGGSAQGEAASQDLRQKVNQKKSPWLRKALPIRKITSTSTTAALQLPDAPLELPDLPESSLLTAPSRLSSGGALGGGGFGRSMGLGAQNGMVFQPLSMFGREIKAKRLAVVLDVSSSMAPFLPRVLDEVDRFAKGSVVVLFPGCGLSSPPKGGLPGDELYRTTTADFEKFWRMGGMASLEEARSFKFNRNDPIPSEDLFRRLAKRPQTHFVHSVGVSYAWVALLSEAVRQADALYWFSDFQDSVDFAQLDIVRDNLMRRRQRLYIHPYQHGSSFDLIRSQLVEPTKGEVIESPFE